MMTITASEYVLMKKYIEDHCGIHLEDGKEYLIETRLSDLVLETGSASFQEFHLKARTDASDKLRDRIIDAMTTNETLWFRDENHWEYLREVAVPRLLDSAERTGRARVWCAAASTGQEPYSLLMLIDEQARARTNPGLVSRVEILGTDISTSALFIAMSARYDTFSIGRGLPPDRRSQYFAQDGGVWVFDQELKKRVTFRKFNLQNPFTPLGNFDLVLCRYVTIYFSERFKRDVFTRMAGVLQAGGVLLLGATESLRGYSEEFEITYHKRALINIRK